MASTLGKVAAAATVLHGADAAQWAVLVAGSNGYWNYRHQADVCHAYQIAKAGGIPEENIITMLYDDVASSSQNPFPGKLFNHPDPHGPGKDVYGGCKIDYRKEEVTPENFIAVLTGANSVKKSLKSTQDDVVFVNFVDHGAPGLIAFPDDIMHKKQLQEALAKMQEKNMFKKLVFYLEACESGSMFEGLKVPGVYALSAANSKESSWGAYCGSEAEVNGKNLDSCLGDLFSVSWMEDEQTHNPATETLQKQFERVKALTSRSHVLQWGDLSFTSDHVSEFLGSHARGLYGFSAPGNYTSFDKVRGIDLRASLRHYERASTPAARRAAAASLHQELAKQEAVELAYRSLTKLAYPEDTEAQAALWTRTENPAWMECEVSGHRALAESCADKFDARSGFALQFHQVVVNLCADVAAGLNLAVTEVARRACHISDSDAVVV